MDVRCLRQEDGDHADLSASLVVGIKQQRRNQNRQGAGLGHPGEGFVAGSLPDHALHRAGFLHFLSQRVQVVGCGDHGEQQDENTTEQQERANPSETPAIPRADRFVAPHPEGGQRQSQPKKIEK